MNVGGSSDGLWILGNQIYENSGDAIQFDPDRDPWDAMVIEDCDLYTDALPTNQASWTAGQIPGENAVDSAHFLAVHGVPDLLDEIWWELQWLLRMQQPSGGVLHKVHVTDWSAESPPSSDAGARRYGPVTASATISASVGATAPGAGSRP